MKYKVSLKNRRGLCYLGSRSAWLLVPSKTEEEALENIKDAIQAYLETVEELTKEKEYRYVEVAV